MSKTFDNTGAREGIDDSFEIGLKSWVNNAPALESNSRNRAMQIMINARDHETTSLNLEGLGLSSLPSQIANLIALEELKLGANQLTNLPPEIGNLINLMELDLLCNQLINLPTEIRKLTS